MPSVARALGWDTGQLVSAVSVLTVAINAPTREIEDGVQAVVRSLSPSGPTAETLGAAEGGEDVTVNYFRAAVAVNDQFHLAANRLL